MAEFQPPDQFHRNTILQTLDQTLLVEAAAGTGKTTCLIGRMVNLIRHGRSCIETIAAVTFTRKAAAELRTRFQLRLEQAANEAQGDERSRLQAAVNQVERCFIGTIHAFCGRLLRERPFEAGVDPDFVELDEDQDAQLREQVWREYVAMLIANDDPILPELEKLGLRISQQTRRSDSIVSELDEIGLDTVELGPGFLDYGRFPDVEDWPANVVPMPDLDPLRSQLLDYVEHMSGFEFPEERGSDELMALYEDIVRKAQITDLARPAELMDLLELFRKSTRVTQKQWPTKQIGKAERDRWVDFIQNVVEPMRQSWAEYRYEPCLRAIKPARDLYDARRAATNSVNFHDLLLLSCRLLRDQPPIRRYFRDRFTHLFVDEFQDTDPIQAEVMLLLTADDPQESNWQACQPVPGSLFVVGDPRQSIYRFRRADIQTYNKVREIIVACGGQVVPLSVNFRSVAPIITFVNDSFDNVFPDEADEFQPANRPLDVGRRDAAIEPSVMKLMIPDSVTFREVAGFESDFIARTIRQAIDGDTGWRLPRTAEERQNGLTEAPVAADFLIITRNRKPLSGLAEALQRYDIPHTVTGGSALNEVPELELLHRCLRAITRSDDQVALVAVLRSELFGVPDTTLYAFKQAGGHFSWRIPIPDTLADEDAVLLRDPFDRLNQYFRWLRKYPAAVAVERIAADLGLFARAAAVADGGLRVGSLMKSIELLRADGSVFTTSDIVARLETLVSHSEQHSGTTVRSPDVPPVRLMNLHQCKGLEAPIVFLAGPFGEKEYPVGVHIDRAGDAPCGYLPVYGPQKRKWGPHALLAQPAGWAGFASREQRFLDAERYRLLYVAATRAGSKLVITQQSGNGNTKNPWGHFESNLEEAAAVPDPVGIQPPIGKTLKLTVDGVVDELAGVDQRWQQATSPTYAIKAIKQMAVQAGKKPRGSAAHGAEWGNVLHTLLETLIKQPDAEIRTLALSALEAESLPLALLDDVLTTVVQVIQSDLWTRARNSKRHFAEVPLQTLSTDDDLPTILRGVIDLVFQEEAGWVIVDYKSERVESSELNELTEYYRPQVDAYADHWKKTTGEPVSERGIFYTHTGEYHVIG